MNNERIETISLLPEAMPLEWFLRLYESLTQEGKDKFFDKENLPCHEDDVETLKQYFRENGLDV